MTILVTGAAGFIGMSLCHVLLACGESVLGIDNLNDYYDPALKQARLATLTSKPGFIFRQMDIADTDPILALRSENIKSIVNLAAQAGVRYSLENPLAYAKSNLLGHLNMLELARAIEGFEHMVYASSSSVYGGNTKIPFSIEDRTDTPVSLYAATKRSDELMSHSYSHLYGIPLTGLRFFTVYGPWGRPDMAAWIFTRKMLAGEPLPVFNNGDMKRDFTYIDDIVAGIVAVLDGPPQPASQQGPQQDRAALAAHRVYNIGNNRSEPLMRMIEILADALGVKPVLDFQPMQPGDVKETYADIDAIAADFGYAPATPIDVGMPNFAAWYRDYHNM
jgi:UDP-glucuronate 4-epimerase